MSIPYDYSYVPPAPRLTIRLAAPDAAFSETGLTALVDTGADVTIVPSRLIEPLDVQADNRKILRSPWGERRPVNVYLLDVGISDIRLPLMEVVADDRGNEVILGRNVLNRFRLVLDGLRQPLEL